VGGLSFPLPTNGNFAPATNFTLIMEASPPNPSPPSIERWVGEASRHMAETVRRFDGIHRRLDEQENRIIALSVEVTVLKTKVGIYSGIGAMIGGVLVAAASKFLGG